MGHVGRARSTTTEKSINYHELLKAKLAKVEEKNPKSIDVTKLAKRWKKAEEQMEELQDRVFPARLRLDLPVDYVEEKDMVRETSQNEKDLLEQDGKLDAEAKRAALEEIERKERVELTRLDVEEKREVTRLAKQTREEMRALMVQIKYFKALAEKKKAWEGKEYIPGWTWPAILTAIARSIDVFTEFGTVVVLGIETFSGTSIEGTDNASSEVSRRLAADEFGFNATTANTSTEEEDASSGSLVSLSIVSVSAVLSIVKDGIEAVGEKAAEKVATLEELLADSSKKIKSFELKLDFWRLYHRLSKGVEGRTLTAKRGLKLLQITQQIKVIEGPDEVTYKLGVKLLRRNKIATSPSRRGKETDFEEAIKQLSTESQKEVFFKRRFSVKKKGCCKKTSAIGITEIVRMNKALKGAFDKIYELMDRLNAGNAQMKQSFRRSASHSSDGSPIISEDDPLRQINYNAEKAVIKRIMEDVHVIFWKLNQYDLNAISDSTAGQCWWARIRDLIKLGVIGGAVLDITDAADESHDIVKKSVFAGYMVAMVASLMTYLNQKVKYNRIYEKTEVIRMLGLSDVEDQLVDLKSLLARLQDYVEEADAQRRMQKFGALVGDLNPTQKKVCGWNVQFIKKVLAGSDEADRCVQLGCLQTCKDRNAYRSIIAMRQRMGEAVSVDSGVVEEIERAVDERESRRAQRGRVRSRVRAGSRSRATACEDVDPVDMQRKYDKVTRRYDKGSDEASELSELSEEDAACPDSEDDLDMETAASGDLVRQIHMQQLRGQEVQYDEVADSAYQAPLTHSIQAAMQSGEDMAESMPVRPTHISIDMNGVDDSSGLVASQASRGVRPRIPNAFTVDARSLQAKSARRGRSVEESKTKTVGQQVLATSAVDLREAPRKGLGKHIYDFFGWIKHQSGLDQERVRATDARVRKVLRQYDSKPRASLCQFEEAEYSGFDSAEFVGTDEESGEEWGASYAGFVPEDTSTSGSGSSGEDEVEEEKMSDDGEV